MRVRKKQAGNARKRDKRTANEMERSVHGRESAQEIDTVTSEARADPGRGIGENGGPAAQTGVSKGVDRTSVRAPRIGTRIAVAENSDPAPGIGTGIGIKIGTGRGGVRPAALLAANISRNLNIEDAAITTLAQATSNPARLVAGTPMEQQGKAPRPGAMTRLKRRKRRRQRRRKFDGT